MSLGVEGLIYQYLQIQNKNGRKIDLSNSVLETDYYEDILQPHLIVTLKIASSYNIVSELPIRSGELVALKYSTPSGTFQLGEIDGSGDIVEETGEMAVYKISGLDTERQSAFFTIHLISPEYFADRKERCVGKFKQDTIDKHVEHILKNVIKTKKKCNIDTVQNPYSFMGNNRKPFYTIQWLGPKSISSIRSGSEGEEGTLNGKAYGVAGYLCFENKDGFNYKSLEGLVSETNVLNGDADIKDVDHGTYSWSGLGGVEKNKPENDVKILNYFMQKNIDLRQALTLGVYANQTTFMNLQNREITFYNYDLKEELTEKLGGESEIDVPVEGTTRFLLKTSDHGFMGIGKNGLEETGKDRTDDAKSYARYNLLFTQALFIQVPCNTKLKVGDIIKCDFPRLREGRANEVDQSSSGKYLIKELCHHFMIGKNITSMKLIRDSYGFSEPKVAT